MGIKVRSKNQKGGITAGVICTNPNSKLKGSKGIWANPLFKYLFIPIVVILIGSFIWNTWGDQMFGKKENNTQEVYNVESHNQQGGVTAGKIDNVNILTDKESLGIREPDGLYQNGKKVGTVFNFLADESSNTFTISDIEFDKPLRDTNSVWQPYEYQNYLIQIKKINSLVTLMPPGANGVNGIILEKR